MVTAAGKLKKIAQVAINKEIYGLSSNLFVYTGYQL
jgi:hypothetical protein